MDITWTFDGIVKAAVLGAFLITLAITGMWILFMITWQWIVSAINKAGIKKRQNDPYDQG